MFDLVSLIPLDRDSIAILLLVVEISIVGPACIHILQSIARGWDGEFLDRFKDKDE